MEFCCSFCGKDSTEVDNDSSNGFSDNLRDFFKLI